MSFAQEQHLRAFHDAPAPAAPSLLRLFRFPLIVLALFGVLFAIPWVWIALGIDAEGMMIFFMVTQWHGPALAVLLIAVWWVFFSGFRWGTRLGAVALALLAATGFYYCLREVELTKGRVSLVPRFHFQWETTAAQRLADYLAQQPSNHDLPPIDAQIGPHDFPRYRGPRFDGKIADLKLNADWNKNPPEVLWQHPCPGGYSGIAVAGNIVVTLELRDDGDNVVCYDRTTGRQRWAFAYGTNYKDPTKMGNGSRSTPTIHDSHVYAIGATGEFVCLTADGKKKWQTNILDDAKAKNTKWGLTASPLIVDDMVIALAGIDEAAPTGSALIAYEQVNGDIRWRTGSRKAGYSSPQLAILGSMPQILVFDGEGLVSYDKSGNELWQHPWPTDYEMNSIQPLVFGPDRVFISSEVKNGSAMLRVLPPENSGAAWSVETLWHSKKLGCRYANPVTDGKNIFSLHEMQGFLTCLDAETGKLRWRRNREGPGQLLMTDGLVLLVNGDTGDVSLWNADGTELARHSPFKVKDKTWNTPALAGDQLFVRNQAEIVCLKLARR